MNATNSIFGLFLVAMIGMIMLATNPTLHDAKTLINSHTTVNVISKLTTWGSGGIVNGMVCRTNFGFFSVYTATGSFLGFKGKCVPIMIGVCGTFLHPTTNSGEWGIPDNWIDCPNAKSCPAFFNITS